MKIPKMTLQELIKIEEQLLKLEMSNIFNLHFNEIITLKAFLKEIGEITSIYLDLVESYSKLIQSEEENLTYEEKKNKLQEYNDNLLKSKVHHFKNERDVLIFLEKYVNII